ncbi:MAG: hypothetical protein ACP5NF_03690 [Thermoanaerobaculum sp.]
MVRKGLALAAVVALAACATTPRGRVFLPELALDRAPGGLSTKQKKAAQQVLALAAAGETKRARDKLSSLPSDHPVRRFLELEVAFAEGTQPLLGQVLAFAQAYPNYPPAWELAVLAGEREGELLEAADAAGQLAALTADSRWERRRKELEERALTQAIAQLQQRWAGGDPVGALSGARQLLERFPHNRPLRELGVGAALATGKLAEAKLLVLPLPEDAAGLELKAQVAAAEGAWEVAAELYRRLPASVPGRCPKVREAEEKARWQRAPERIAKAAKAARLSRGELAALVVFYFPQLAEKAAGPAPLFEDLVGYPYQTEVLVLVRAGVMTGDPLARRFSPSRPVSPRELERVLQRLVEVLGLPGAVVCRGEASAGGCLGAEESGNTVSGEGAVRLLSGIWEKLPC